MLKKLYPQDQIEKYLIIDLLAITYLFYQVFIVYGFNYITLKVILFLLLLLSHYVGLWYRDYRLLIASLAGSFLLVGLAIYADSWIMMYAFVFADLLGRANRKAIMIAGMAGFVAMYIVNGWITEGNPFAFLTTMYFPIMVAQLATPIVVHTREKNNILKDRLAIANAQLERYIQEEERNRIARDLHDTLGQTLMMIKLKSELTIRLVEKDPDKAKHELNDILSTSRYALKQVRELVTDMKFISLKKELEQSKDILQKAGIELVIKEDGSFFMNPLSNVAETMMALSVREAITNIIKHSKASQCSIIQIVDSEHYCIQVSDNGNGSLKQGEGIGLQSMKERMDMLQGNLHMEASPDNGTIITFKVPLISNGRG